MGPRDKEDPVLTEIVRQRLAQLLAESLPRRVRPDEAGVRPPEGTPDDESFAPTPSESVQASGRRARGNDPELLRPDDEVASRVDAAPRRSFGRAHVGVVVGMLLVGLLVAGWAVLRARPVAIASPTAAPPTVTPATGAGRAPASRSSSSATPTAQILVHVLGAVKKPGVVALPEHARVREALEAAGGLRREAAPGELNLAQVLADGQQVVIGTDRQRSGEIRDGSGPTQRGGSDAVSDGGTQVDLNTATQTQLEALPGVGPVTAAKIVAWREEHGRFSRVEELQEIDGIGPKTFAQISSHARV